jgi:intracellular protein transport protein USO1
VGDYQPMNWFFGATTDSPQIENKEVEETLQKISNSTLLEDRIDAIQKLSELSADETKHSKFGEESVKIVFEQLKIQHENVELVKQLLLVILNLEKVFSFFLNSSQSEIFIKNLLKPEYIRGIVTLLDLNEEYIKYHSVQLLTKLLKKDIETVQQGILSEPIGVARLVDLLRHGEEIIRNECLLLMNNLTKGGSPEILKIIAFEGAFEKLLNIINEEGGNTGGIIVLDCIVILNNLLVGNSSNQTHFQVLGFQQKIKNKKVVFHTLKV